MKSAIKILLAVGMVSCLFLGSAQALTINYTDAYANWPGYPKSPFTVNPNDTIGDSPMISGASITMTDGTRYLQSITFDITQNRLPETLFINSSWIGGEIYDNWDFAVVTPPTNLIFSVFDSVSPSFTPADYLLVTDTSGRLGHPFSIIGSDLSPAAGFLGVTYNGNVLTYSFDTAAHITMGDRFVFGLSEDCGNDVFLTPVPEPLSLLFLGLGLLGVVGIGRKMRKVS